MHERTDGRRIEARAGWISTAGKKGRDFYIHINELVKSPGPLINHLLIDASAESLSVVVRSPVAPVRLRDLRVAIRKLLFQAFFQIAIAAAKTAFCRVSGFLSICRNLTDCLAPSSIPIWGIRMRECKSGFLRTTGRRATEIHQY